MQYMDRIYVRHQNKTPVHQLGLDLWRDLVIYDASIEGRLRSNLLDFVNRERNGELIDQSLIKSITTVSQSCRHLMTRSCLCKCLHTISVVACASVRSVSCLAKGIVCCIQQFLVTRRQFTLSRFWLYCLAGLVLQASSRNVNEIS